MEPCCGRWGSWYCCAWWVRLARGHNNLRRRLPRLTVLRASDCWRRSWYRSSPAGYAWARAAEAQGQGADALYLQLALLDEWLLALEGRPAQGGRTIEVAIAHGREVDADELQRRARRAWPSILKAHLRPQWDMDGPSAPLPSELDALGADIAQEGPGLWVHRAKDGRPRGLYLWLGVRNGLGEPVPLPEFALRLGHPGQQTAVPLM